MCGVFIHLIWYIIFDLHPVFYLTFPISLALGPCFGTYVCTLRLCVAFYHMHLFSLCLSNYFNIIVIERRRANDFQDGEKYKIWYVYNIALSIIIITIKDGQTIINDTNILNLPPLMNLSILPRLPVRCCFICLQMKTLCRTLQESWTEGECQPY